MTEQLYEALGMTREQANKVAEELAGGSVMWQNGHAWISMTLVVKPMGCSCAHCANLKDGDDHG